MTDVQEGQSMLRLPGCTITVTRTPPTARRRPPALRVLAMSAGAFAVTGVAAQASPTPNPNPGAAVNTVVTVSPPIKSVTVTLPNNATTLTYGGCSGGSSTPTSLGFPNATCSTAAYTVTNSGNTAEQINVQGSAAFPSDNGTPAWQLCDPTVAPCAGTQPGADQYENVDQGSAASMFLTAAPKQDSAVSTGAVPAGQAASEHLVITGPQSSTDQSASFSMTVVYTAV
jgi:hypothetical protein